MAITKPNPPLLNIPLYLAYNSACDSAFLLIKTLHIQETRMKMQMVALAILHFYILVSYTEKYMTYDVFSVLMFVCGFCVNVKINN